MWRFLIDSYWATKTLRPIKDQRSFINESGLFLLTGAEAEVGRHYTCVCHYSAKEATMSHRRHVVLVNFDFSRVITVPPSKVPVECWGRGMRHSTGETRSILSRNRTNAIEPVGGHFCTAATGNGKFSISRKSFLFGSRAQTLAKFALIF